MPEKYFKEKLWGSMEKECGQWCGQWQMPIDALSTFSGRKASRWPM